MPVGAVGAIGSENVSVPSVVQREGCPVVAGSGTAPRSICREDSAVCALNRRQLLCAAAGVALPGRVLGAEAGSQSGPAPAAGEWFPRQDPALVERIVAAAHRDLGEVRELVGARPELAKSMWDWGFGDWESPLGAASHTGQREIALFLLAHGARPTLFSAAMLGQLEVVRAFVAAVPGVQATLGPHGITLLAHARAGGELAAAVAAYLEEIGGADLRSVDVPLDPSVQARHAGTYRFGGGARDTLFVAAAGSGLTIARREGAPRRLLHDGAGRFAPAGAPSVEVRFCMADSASSWLSIAGGGVVVEAVRVPTVNGMR